MSGKNSPSSRRRGNKSSGENRPANLLYPFLWQTDLDAEATFGIQETALAVVSHGVTIADASVTGFPLIYVNEAFCAMTGYTPLEALGKNCKFLQGPSTEAKSIETLREALRKGEGCTVVLKNFRKDGSPFWNEVTLTPVYNADGKITQVIGVQHDVTRRTEAEENFLQAQKKLERTTLEMAQITLELERANTKNYYDAQHDALTGLANRLLFHDQLNHVFERNKRRPEKPFALLYLDLDDFKGVNDTLGHDAGDALLRNVAQNLKTCVRPSDTVARLGGDEFALLLEDLESPNESLSVAGRVQKLLAELLGSTDAVTVSVSIGITVYTPHYKTATEMLRDADTAMYAAKHSGKNQLVMFGNMPDSEGGGEG
jgi:diguanylate cyclase (GGDEF)-like protein/PAS domain S-box-containing protein